MEGDRRVVDVQAALERRDLDGVGDDATIADAVSELIAGSSALPAARAAAARTGGELAQQQFYDSAENPELLSVELIPVVVSIQEGDPSRPTRRFVPTT